MKPFVIAALVFAVSMVGSPSSGAEDVPADTEETEATEDVSEDESATREFNEPVDEILVTANKREQSIQDVPISMKALTGEFLEDAGLTDFSRLQQYVPNVKINGVTDTRGTIIRIRGIGSVGSNSGIDPSVGVFIDGIYQGRTGMSVGDLLDVERVEVLRGPQGTLYGKNTAAGAINIYSKRPTYDWDATIEGVVGNYDQYETRASVNIPIIEDLMATRFSAYWVNRDGFDKNTFTGDDINDANKMGAKLRTVFDFTDNFSVLVTGDYGYENTECCVPDIITYEGFASLHPSTTFQTVSALPGNPPLEKADPFDRKVSVDREPRNRVNVQGLSLDATYEFGDVPLIADSTLNFLSSYRKYSSDSAFDGDFSVYDVVYAYTNTDLHQYSGELRLTSPSGGWLEYQTGLYFFHQNQTTVDRNGFEMDFSDLFPFATMPTSNINDNNHQTNSYAAFGQATVKPFEFVSLTGGIRYSYEHKTRVGSMISNSVIEAPPVSGPPIFQDQSRRVTDWSPMAALRIFPTEDTMIYGSVARGFKSGGFNQLRTLVGVPGEVEDEKSTNYEVGLRTTWFDGRLTLNGTMFYTDYEDFQVQTFDGGGINVLNAGTFQSYGFEADVIAVPLPDLVLQSSIGYNQTEYETFPLGEQTVEQRTLATSADPLGFLFGNLLCQGGLLGGLSAVDCSQDLAGEVLDSAPRLTISNSIQYQHLLPGVPIEWFIRGEYNYTSKQWLAQDLDGNLKQAHTKLVNLRTGFRSDKDEFNWELTFWVQNLTDEHYNVAAFDVPTLNGYAGVNAEPRKFGVTFRLDI